MESCFLYQSWTFQTLVMFFGLTNSLATFQTMMDSIFKGLISKEEGYSLLTRHSDLHQDLRRTLGSSQTGGQFTSHSQPFP